MTDVTLHRVIKDEELKRFSYYVRNKEADQTLVEGIEHGNPECFKVVLLNKHIQVLIHRNTLETNSTNMQLPLK